MNSNPIIFNKGLVISRLEFGKDHFSMLAYIYARTTADPKGMLEGRVIACLDAARLRINEKKHPGIEITRTSPWKSEWGTRKKLSDYGNGYYPDHDDVDVIADLEAAGLATFINSTNLLVSLTEAGERLAKEIVSWKALGGQFATFPDDPLRNKVYWRGQTTKLWYGIALPGCPSVVGTIRENVEGKFEWSARTMLNTRVDGQAPTGIADSLEEAKETICTLLRDTKTLE